MKLIIYFVLLPVIAVAFIVIAVTGKPRMVWGKRGTHYFTRVEQAVVCSFWGIVILFGAIIRLVPTLPPNKVTVLLTGMNNLLGPMTLISMFFSMPLLVGGASGLFRNYARASLTEKVGDSAAAILGLVILIADLFQIVAAARAAF